MFLLDTNSLIYLFFEKLAQGKFSNEAITRMLFANKLYVNICSIWEIAIKIKIGKLNIKTSMTNLISECHRQNILIYPIEPKYIDKTLELNLYKDHKDPFDKMIISNAIMENLTLISSDTNIRKYDYGVKILW